MTIEAVLCGDRRIIRGMAVAARSALEHASETINFGIICQGYSEKDKAMLRESWAHERLGTVEFRDIADGQLKNFRSTAYLKSKASYARYFFADLFPDLSRCIYLDSDLIVLRDLAEVMHMDLGDKVMAAVPDLGVRLEDANPAARLGIADNKAYFNAGFLVIDLEFWRESGMTDQIVQLSLDKKDILHSQDQDALNVMFEGRTMLLNPIWNTSQYEKEDPIDGRIIHLIGGVKPWHARYEQKFADPYYRDVIYARFYEILERTAYRGKRPWNLFGIGEIAEWVDAKIPTPDMVRRKIRLLLDGQR